MKAPMLKVRVLGRGLQLRKLANVAAPVGQFSGRDSQVTSGTFDEVRGWNKGWGKYGKT